MVRHQLLVVGTDDGQLTTDDKTVKLYREARFLAEGKVSQRSSPHHNDIHRTDGIYPVRAMKTSKSKPHHCKAELNFA
jgi:hypothetical protein